MSQQEMEDVSREAIDSFTTSYEKRMTDTPTRNDVETLLSGYDDKISQYLAPAMQEDGTYPEDTISEIDDDAEVVLASYNSGDRIYELANNIISADTQDIGTYWETEQGEDFVMWTEAAVDSLMDGVSLRPLPDIAGEETPDNAQYSDLLETYVKREVLTRHLKYQETGEGMFDPDRFEHKGNPIDP